MVLDNALKVHIPTLLLQLVKMEINQLQKFILDLGSKTKNVVLVNKIILVSDTTTVIGRMEKKMEKVLWSISIKTSTQANGKTVKKMDKEPIFSMTLEWNSLDHLKEEIWLMENGLIQTEHSSRVTLIITNQKEKENGTSRTEMSSLVSTLKSLELMLKASKLNLHGKPLAILHVLNE